jgi:hypothetical protein
MPEKFYFIIAILLIFVYFFFLARKNSSIVSAEKDRLKKLHYDKTVFLCDEVEDLGSGLIQFYGDPIGGFIRPGMRINIPNGRDYVIKEVYAADDTPDKPDLEINSGMENTTIVIETNDFDFDNIYQVLKNSKVMVLNILE